MSSKRIYLDQYARPRHRDETRWPVQFWHIDTGMATLLILLTAVDEGLGAVYFGIVDHETRALRAEFGIPEDHQPIGAIAAPRPTGTWPRSRTAALTPKTSPPGSPISEPGQRN